MRPGQVLILLFMLQTLWVRGQVSKTQTFQLTWEEMSLISETLDLNLQLPVVKGQLFNKNGVPTFHASIEMQNNGIIQDYQIKNVKFSSISSQQLNGIDPGDVPEDINPELSVSRGRQKSFALLRLNPLIRRNGQVQKVTSFELTYQVGSGQTGIANDDTGNPDKRRTSAIKENSVLRQGDWFKFRIDTTGVFRIDRDLLREIGIDPGQVDPRNIRIYGNGGKMLPQNNSIFRYDDLEENAIYVEGEGDGSFDEDDYILFFGEGPDQWFIDGDDFFSSRHQTNLYSDHSYYFITSDLGPGKRIGTAEPVDEIAEVNLDTYQEMAVHESESVNLFSNGQQWLGEDFSFENSQAFRFEFTDLETSEPVTIRIRGAAVSFSDTFMNTTVNGSSLVQLNFRAQSPGSLTLASTDEDAGSVNISSEQIVIGIDYNNNGNPSSRAYLDYIEVLGTKRLVARGSQFRFRNTRTDDSDQVYQFSIQNAGNILSLWEVTDPRNPRIIQNQSTGGSFEFRLRGEDIREYAVLGVNDFYEPEALDGSPVPNQNLHALNNIEYLVISPDHLMGEAERLAAYHRDNSGLETAVVDLATVYNEFASGSPDLTAIRDFTRHLYLRSSAEKQIRFLCLFGDTSFDFKDRITDNNNVVPAFQSYESFNLATSYVTDDYFGMMDENEGDLTGAELQDVATGRIPVTTAMEAREAVDKILQYYSSNSLGDWRNTVAFVADDPDRPEEFVLQENVEAIAQEVAERRPALNLKKIYSDAYPQESTAGGERYPTVNTAIDNAIETGVLIMDYFGHGGVNGWANERILEVPQVQNWSNFSTLPLLITVTCEFTRYDNPLRQTAGEFALLNNKGGPVSLISTTREIFISVGQEFNKTLFDELLGSDSQDYSISESLMRSKYAFSSAQRFFVYSFGDPAMKLALGKPDIRLTKMNDRDLNQAADTLKALSRVKLEGIVSDSQGNVLSDFSGTLSATIFDKALDKTTLDNDNFGKKMEFKSIESKIFRGRASVENGRFSFDFVVPKDIRIAFGESKISLYAEDQSTDLSGADRSIIIGGLDPNAPVDETGPTIRLFMNDESFVDGGNTNSSPVLYAILEDDSGINTSITSVDHDIVAILDDDQANPYVLNDYYETEINNFKKGSVKFPFRELEPGLHTIKFKCWDTYNNPSESTLSFIVVNDNDLILSNVLNYPNPFVNYTEFWFNHNKPNESLEVQVQIFTISGKLVKTLNRSVQSDGLLSREISWNGLDDFGNKIGKGVYVYRLHVRSTLSNATAEKFEKLVILQ